MLTAVRHLWVDNATPSDWTNKVQRTPLARRHTALAIHKAKEAKRKNVWKLEKRSPPVGWVNRTNGQVLHQIKDASNELDEGCEDTTTHNAVGFRAANISKATIAKRRTLMQMQAATGSSVMSTSHTIKGLSPSISPGLRRDPFDTLPLSGENVALSVDYYVHTWAASQLSVATPVVESPYLKSTFPMILEDEILLESVVLMTQCIIERRNRPSCRPSAQLLKQKGKVIKGLKARLSNKRYVVDNALVAIVLHFAAMDHIFGNYKSYKAQIKNLRLLSASKQHSIGDDLTSRIQIGYISMSEFETDSMDYAERKKRSRKGRSTNIVPFPSLAPDTTSMDLESIGLAYPMYPFSPSYLRLVSGLPVGIRELALQSMFSTRMVDMMSSMSDWMAPQPRLPNSDRGPESDVYACNTPWQELRTTFQLLRIVNGNRDPPTIVQMSAAATAVPLNFEACVRLASIITLQQKRHAFYLPDLYIFMLDDLVEMLLQLWALHKRSVAQTDGLIWLSVVAATHASRLCTTLVGKVDDLKTQVSAALLLSGEDGWEALEGRLRKFCWYELLVEQWKSCWTGT